MTKFEAYLMNTALLEDVLECISNTFPCFIDREYVEMRVLFLAGGLAGHASPHFPLYHITAHFVKRFFQKKCTKKDPEIYAIF